MARAEVREHTIPHETFHYKWDNSLPPAVEIGDGDVVNFDTEEVTSGQLKQGDPASKLGSLDFDKLYPLGGPVFVKGAEPGDVLEVEILTLRPGSWGWTALLPGLGLLASDFPDPYVRYFELGNRTSAELRQDIHIPIAPFCGTMGVATDEAGPHEAVPAGVRGRRNVLGRRLPCRAGRRRGLRYRDRMPDDILAPVQRRQGRVLAAMELPLSDATDATPAAKRCGRLSRRVRARTGPDGERPQRGTRHDRLAGGRPRPEPGGRIHPLQPGGRPPHQPDRRPAELRGFLLHAAERLQVKTAVFRGPIRRLFFGSPCTVRHTDCSLGQG